MALYIISGVDDISVGLCHCMAVSRSLRWVVDKLIDYTDAAPYASRCVPARRTVVLAQVPPCHTVKKPSAAVTNPLHKRYRGRETLAPSWAFPATALGAMGGPRLPDEWKSRTRPAGTTTTPAPCRKPSSTSRQRFERPGATLPAMLQPSHGPG